MDKTSKRKIVFICSPLRCRVCDPTILCTCGGFESNRKAAEALCRMATFKGYIPIAPHVYLTRFLDEFSEEERALGLNIGLQLLDMCDEMWVFNVGVKLDGTPVLTEGMDMEVEYAKKIGKSISYIAQL